MATKYPYQAQTVYVPPELAGVILDSVAHDHELADGWRIVTPQGNAEFMTAPILIHPAAKYMPIRLASGLLHSGGRTVAVELELQAWSGTRSELGLRYAGGSDGWYKRLTAPGETAYLKTGDSVLRVIADEMEHWPTAFLGGLVDEELLRAS